MHPKVLQVQITADQDPRSPIDRLDLRPGQAIQMVGTREERERIVLHMPKLEPHESRLAVRVEPEDGIEDTMISMELAQFWPRVDVMRTDLTCSRP